MASLICGMFFCKAGFASDLMLVHARIYTSPAEKPIDDGTVVIHNGQIRAVGPSSTTKGPRLARLVTVVNCTGMTITAGLWNSHVHIFTEELLHADQKSPAQLTSTLQAMFTRWGFTTVFDTASILTNTNVIRRRIASGEVVGPKILTVGDPFYPENGVPVYIQGFLKENHIRLPEDHSDAEAATRVRQQIRDGADGIKIFAGSIENDGVLLMPLGRAKAIVAEAHRLGRPVIAHPSNEQGVDLALESGVDVLAHVALMGGSMVSDPCRTHESSPHGSHPHSYPLRCRSEEGSRLA
jgi:imidazolonepropionase-like amidohydrolase